MVLMVCYINFGLFLLWKLLWFVVVEVSNIEYYLRIGGGMVCNVEVYI